MVYWHGLMHRLVKAAVKCPKAPEWQDYVFNLAEMGLMKSYDSDSKYLSALTVSFHTELCLSDHFGDCSQAHLDCEFEWFE